MCVLFTDDNNGIGNERKPCNTDVKSINKLETIEQKVMVVIDKLSVVLLYGCGIFDNLIQLHKKEVQDGANRSEVIVRK